MKRIWMTVICILLALLLASCGKSDQEKYEEAEEKITQGAYEESVEVFEQLEGYEDSDRYADYARCLQLGAEGQYDQAISGLTELGDFEQAPAYIIYYTGRRYEQQQDWDRAEAEYSRVPGLADASQRLQQLDDRRLESQFGAARAALGAEWTVNDIMTFRALVQQRYSDGSDRMLQEVYALAGEKLAEQNFSVAYGIYRVLASENYRDAQTMLSETRYQEAVAGLSSNRTAAMNTLNTLAGEGFSKAGTLLADIAYQDARQLLDGGQYPAAAEAFDALGSYSNAQEMAKEARYQEALRLEAAGSGHAAQAYELFGAISGYRDSRAHQEAYETAYARAEALLTADDAQAAETAFEALGTYGDSAQRALAARYRRAEQLMDAKSYDEARALYTELGDYAEARTMLKEADYREAADLLAAGSYDEACAQFRTLDDYRDAANMAKECRYQQAGALLAQGEREQAIAVYSGVSSYRDSSMIVRQIHAEDSFDSGDYARAWSLFRRMDEAYQTRNAQYAELYQQAAALRDAGSHAEAAAAFEALGSYSDAASQCRNARYQQAAACAAAGDYEQAVALYSALNDVDMANSIIYTHAEALAAEGDYVEAARQWHRIRSYQDSRERSYNLGVTLSGQQQYAQALEILDMDTGYQDTKNQIYLLAGAAVEAGEYETAISAYDCLGFFKESRDRKKATMYTYAELCLEQAQYDTAAELFEDLYDYRDAPARRLETAYLAANAAYEQAEYAAAAQGFLALGEYEDSAERANDAAYQHAQALALQEEYAAACEAFTALSDYQDSQARATQCCYQNGVQQMNAGNHEAACEAFLAVEGYEQSAALLSQCQYQLAQSSLAQGNPLRAVELYQHLGDYEDSEQQLRASYAALGDAYMQSQQTHQAYLCYQAAIGHADAQQKAEAAAYQLAQSCFAAQAYADAAGWYAAAGSHEGAQAGLLSVVDHYIAQQEYGQAEAVLAHLADSPEAAQRLVAMAEHFEAQNDQLSAVRLLGQAGSDQDALSRCQAQTYNLASEAMGSGENLRAYELYNSVRDYSDAAEMADALAIQLAFRPGNELSFGAWQQDGDAAGEAEPIEWIVLTAADGRALLVSKYGLAPAPRMETEAAAEADAETEAEVAPETAAEETAHGWDVVQLQAWLNGTFMQQAFTEEQRALLTAVELSGSGELAQVFLLSAQELAHFTSADLPLVGSPTMSAVLAGAGVDQQKRGAWMLRDVDAESSQPYIVSSTGETVPCSDQMTALPALRPAVWLDLTSPAAAQLMDDAQLLADLDRETTIRPTLDELRGMVESARQTYYLTSLVRYNNQNESYSHGIGFDASLSNCQLTFNLPEDCRTVTATIMGIRSSREGHVTQSGKRFNIDYLADGVQIRSDRNVTENDKLTITLDVRGADKLQIRATNSGSYSCGIFGLVDIAFTVDGVPPYNEQNPYLPESLAATLNPESAAQVNADYLAACGLLQSQAYAQAREAFLQHPDYADSAERIRECEYRMALRALALGEYEEAHDLLCGLLDDSDVRRIVMTNTHLIERALPNVNPEFVRREACVVGQYVTFGHYEQDNVTGNGKEPIEWLVLAADETSATLISRYALDAHDYSSNGRRVTWDQSAIRPWLNSTFLQAAFTAEEQGQILLTNVTADRHPDHPNLDVGQATQDYVYLLSVREARTYFTSDAARRAVGTAYAYARRAFVDGTVYWYLRTPANTNYRPSSDVHCDGVTGREGSYWYYDKGAVRPVIRIDLNIDPIGKLLVQAGLLEHTN